MDKIDTLRRYGLFDAKAPRYTSYPSANHFQNGCGQRHQNAWLSALSDESPLSIYVHIPFCKRLCWFCACRTQGTKTLRPVENYVDVLRQEITHVRHLMTGQPRMARLHLGGGTPTILSPQIMADLLTHLFEAFERTEDFEFSVEIDPTEASDALLDCLIQSGMNRASIGVQDFSPKVQNAIGRIQTLEQTSHVIERLRAAGLRSLNLDLLYGLPHQTQESFDETLGHVLALEPDRLAIYGYAHVPWMSKRQVMIKSDDLPDSLLRFTLAQRAYDLFTQQGYEPIGIDHFALPSDSLARASDEGLLARNFQGYTDDPCETLIGLGASSISRFKQGYVQNATATSAYTERVTQGGLAGYKGYDMGAQDHLIARIIADLMCHFSFFEHALTRDFPEHKDLIHSTGVSLMQSFPDIFFIATDGLQMRPFARPLARVIARHIDDFTSTEEAHSAAI